jgi:hypothetical protein
MMHGAHLPEVRWRRAVQDVRHVLEQRPVRHSYIFSLPRRDRLIATPVGSRAGGA